MALTAANADGSGESDLGSHREVEVDFESNMWKVTMTSLL